MFFGVEKILNGAKARTNETGFQFCCIHHFGHKKDFNRLQKRSTTNTNNTTQATTHQQNGSTSKDVSTSIRSPQRIGWCLRETGLRLRIGLTRRSVLGNFSDISPYVLDSTSIFSSQWQQQERRSWDHQREGRICEPKYSEKARPQLRVSRRDLKL